MSTLKGQPTSAREILGADEDGNILRRGLVLAGGGAKGAYAFGCMEAFKELGIKFDAVAGTSVGGLNATLWATDSLSEGRKIWEGLSFSSTYPVKMLDARRHSRLFIRIFSMAYVTLRIFWDGLNGIRLPHKHASRAVLDVFLQIDVLLFALGVGAWRQLAAGGVEKVVQVIAVQIVLVIVVFRMFNPSNRTSRKVHKAAMTLGLALILSAAFWKDFQHLGKIYQVASLALGIGLGALLVHAAMWLLDRAFATEISVLQQGPLGEALKRVLSNASPPKCSAYVTAAQMTDCFDPDAPTYAAPWSVGIPSPAAPIVAAPKETWVPHYMRVDQMTLDETVDACLASAALPFGIVPPVKIGGRSYVDGGVADNVPLFPLVQNHALVEVFVVLLEPFDDEQSAIALNKLTSEGWTETDRLIRVAAAGVPDGEWTRGETPFVRADPPVCIPRRKPDRFPLIRVFAPKKSLGNFLSGTLNFDGEYAKRLMVMGKADAKEALSKGFFLSIKISE
jgi:predicted acylesterase/phospholipase RssA